MHRTRPVGARTGGFGSGVNEGEDEARRAEQLLIRSGVNEGGDEARRAEQLLIGSGVNECLQGRGVSHQF